MIIEEENDKKPPACVIPIKSPMIPLKLYHCWASSVLDRLWRFDWFCTVDNTPLHSHSKKGRDFGGYPCESWNSPGGYRGPWISGVM